MKDFLECTALITGASAGIGREIARQLAPLAATLVLVARRTERLAELRDELLQINPDLHVHCLTVDLSVTAEVESLCDFARDEMLDLDFLINNAGFGDNGPFETSDWSKIDRMLKVNVVALTTLCHRLIPTLRHHRPGAILNVSSIASLLPLPTMGVYAATKAYVSSFSESLRVELRGTGISVTYLCPGPVETEFQTVARREGVKHQPPSFVYVPAAQVARTALLAVSRDRARVIPGIWMILAMMLFAVLPLAVLRVFFEGNARVQRQRERERLEEQHRVLQTHTA